MSTTAAPAESPAPRGRRWLSIALVVSLGVNLLLIGAAASAAWRFRHGPPSPRGNSSLLGYAATLPPGRKSELWQATKAERHGMLPLRQEVQAARSELREALLTDPFDRDRFSRAQTHLLEAESKARAEAQKLFLSIASHLTKEERAAFADWRPHGGRPGWWRKGGQQPAPESSPAGQPR